MTIPVWMLLGFAIWTMILLLSTIAVYRWSRILTGRAAIKDFRADQVEGEDWYKRAMRAHANCIENLPVFGAIVFALYVSGVRSPAADYLSIAVLVSRVMQSVVHVAFVPTNTATSARFVLFSIQLVSFAALIVIIVRRAAIMG
jgi:uncharacterized MAPEG superfamily protein